MITCRYCNKELESEPNCCKECWSLIKWSRNQNLIVKPKDKKTYKRRDKNKKARKARKKNKKR